MSYICNYTCRYVSLSCNTDTLNIPITQVYGKSHSPCLKGTITLKLNGYLCYKSCHIIHIQLKREIIICGVTMIKSTCNSNISHTCIFVLMSLNYSSKIHADELKHHFLLFHATMIFNQCLAIQRFNKPAVSITLDRIS